LKWPPLAGLSQSLILLKPCTKADPPLRQLLTLIYSFPPPLFSETPWYCRLEAFITCVTIVAHAIGSLGPAFVTNAIVQGRHVDVNQLLILNGFAWLCGVVMASLWHQQDFLGNFMGWACICRSEPRAFRASFIALSIVFGERCWRCCDVDGFSEQRGS
jgi:hypothetical protein